MADVADRGFGPSLSAAGPVRTRSEWVKIFLGFGGMVFGQFMAILDIQIVASSLSQIQAGVGASADEISWVQTIYLLAEVVIIPLTAYLSKLWGTRPFFLAACAAFMLMSVATGLSTSIEMMIVTRALQGLAAGAMIPMVFATAMTIFPPERRITANVITGLIITLAPTIGPTLGGHLTEWLTWRWLFFINVPAGVVVLFLVGRYGGFDKGDPSLAKGIDWFGLATMTASLLTMQYVLEEGARAGWFKDDLILWLTVTAAITGVAFIWRQLTYRQPIVSLRPFSDRNFSIGMIMGAISGMSLFGATFILPLFLAQILHYSSAEVGTTMVVSGLTMFLSAPIAGRLAKYAEPRLAMFVGFGLTAYGIGMGARVTEDWSFWHFALLQAVRSLGTMIAMTGSQQITIATLPTSLMKEASGLLNLIRNVGGAVGLALLSTVISHQTAVHYGELTERVNSGNQASLDMMANLGAMMQQSASMDPEGAGRKAFAGMLHQKAAVLAFGDAFVFLAAGCLIAALIVVFASPAKAKVQPGMGGH